MNNTKPIKSLTEAAVLAFSFGLMANAVPVMEMSQEQTVSDTPSARQQAIPLIAV